jgi:hypothetical protein
MYYNERRSPRKCFTPISKIIPTSFPTFLLQKICHLRHDVKQRKHLHISLKTTRDLFHSLSVKEELNNRGIEWKMILKRAPWFGGMSKRLIGLTKTTTKIVLGHSYVTYETLQTVITEIGAMIYARPLTYVCSGNLDEPKVLTPSHLLYDRRITKLPDEDVLTCTFPTQSDRSSVIKQVMIQTKLINHFRDR